MNILIDINVLLDILQRRAPFFEDSYQALHKAIENNVACFISASAATDIFYILRKSLGSTKQAKKQIEQLAQLVSFADVQGIDIHAALMRPMSDFEDAVTDAVAERIGASHILTRNVKDFTASIVPTILPADFVNLF